MTDELQEFWDLGWNEFWYGAKQTDCPMFPEQEKRDEWMLGWLAAQSAENHAEGN